MSRHVLESDKVGNRRRKLPPNRPLRKETNAILIERSTGGFSLFADSEAAEKSFVIRSLRACSDKIGLASAGLFLLYCLSSLLSLLTSGHMGPLSFESVVLSSLQCLTWQLSESTFIIASFLGLFHIYLCYLQQDLSRVKWAALVILLLVPVSFHVVSLQVHRWKCSPLLFFFVVSFCLFAGFVCSPASIRTCTTLTASYFSGAAIPPAAAVESNLNLFPP